ncbi:Transposon protein, putative, Mutator sub-class [Hordeum vulgare]|nr:Transposon protein, putative, Mutator sub-class [Hordeum vulgare]
MQSPVERIGSNPRQIIHGLNLGLILRWLSGWRLEWKLVCCVSDADAVELNYFSSDEQRFLPLTCDDHMPLLFAGIVGCRFGKLQIDVLQPRAERVKGKGVQTSSACANSQHPGTPCRSTPSKASGSWSHNMPAANCGSDSAAASRVRPAVGVEEDAEPDEAVPTNDDEDEMMFPELVDVASQQAVDDEYMEEPISQARFDDTDDEEKVENMDSLIEDEYDDKEKPTEAHLSTWRGRGKAKRKLAKTRWVADAILDWLREEPGLGPTTLHGKLFEKYKIEIPYMRIFNAREKALDRINGQWNDTFHLLYTFKAEVEMASPGSVVEIDKHTVQFKIKGKSFQKECFRRAFVCFKACWQGFLDGCRPYLAVDATHLTGRWRGQLVAASAVDGHNWLFPVAFGVVEAESEESWVWFLQQLRNIIGTPPGLAIHTDACKGLESAVEIVFRRVEHRESKGSMNTI